MENEYLTEPLVSVIVPVYNVEPYLREALDSVIHQTYRKLEILVIDDGSTDGSGRICDEYAALDPRIKVFHQENRGLSAARNVGLDAMSGDVVAFLDSDDAFKPEMIENMLAEMQRHQADIAICGIARCYTEGSLEGAPTTPYLELENAVLTPKEALQQLAEGRMYHYVWNKLFVSRLWDTIRFPEGRVYEDVFVIHHVFSKAACVVFLPEIYITYRIHPGSITSTTAQKSFRDFIAAHREFESFVSKHVPELFDEGMRNTLRWHQLRSEIAKWGRLPQAELAGADDIYESIIALGERCDLSAANFKTRFAYQMLRSSPRGFRCFAVVYRCLKRVANRPRK